MFEKVYTLLSHEEIDQNIADLSRFMQKYEYRPEYKEALAFLGQVQQVNAALRSGMVLSWWATGYMRGYQTLKQVHIWCDFWDEERTKLAHYSAWYEIDPPYTYYETGAPPQFCIPKNLERNNEWSSLMMQMRAGGHRHVRDWITCFYCGRDWDDIEHEGHTHVFLPGQDQCYYCTKKEGK